MSTLQIMTLKTVMPLLNSLSDGLNLCNKEGLTSGKMIDYIYKNEPSGKFLIGKFIDKIFISHAGWEGIRNRKENIKKFLQYAITQTECDKDNVFILDVASGPAKYILETLCKYEDSNVKALCRDIDERCLKEAQAKANELNLNNISFKKGDAFLQEDFNFEQAPDIVIASGFYDWIVDDELIKLSMRLIYQALPKGGYFIFSNQSGHKDMELVSAVFTDFNKNPLRMTVRESKLMNQWAKEIGFTILDTKHDNPGYYGVTLTQKG